MCSGYDDIYIWGLKDLAQPLGKVHLPDCHQVNCMIRVKRQVRRGRLPTLRLRGGRGTGSPPAVGRVKHSPHTDEGSLLGWAVC